MAVSERSFNLTNWEEHPTDNRYFIFRFNKEDRAARFKELLGKEGIEFRSHEEDGLLLFAVAREDFDKARKMNYLVMAENREPMIANSYLRWGFVLFILAAVTISLIGHCNKKVVGQEGIHTIPLEKHDSAL